MSAQEQAHVRAALRFLRLRCGTWEAVAKVLRFRPKTLHGVIGGATVTASLALRTARLAGASVDDLLAGKFPPAGKCPYCGHQKQDDEPS